MKQFLVWSLQIYIDALNVMQITRSVQWYSLSHSLVKHWQSRWTVPLSGTSMWCVCVHVHAKSFQLCPSLGGPIDCSPPGSSVHGILQIRIQEWVAMDSSRGSDSGTEPISLRSPKLGGGFFITSATWEALRSSWPRDQTRISCIGRQVPYQTE